jgi:hypothetical protein
MSPMSESGSNEDDVNSADVEAFRQALQERGGALAMAAKLNEGIFEASGLDAVTFGMVRLAALAAVGGSEEVWRPSLELAEGLGVTGEQALATMIAIAPLIGTVRFNDAMMRIEDA